jgi:hypothetical protein
MIGIECMVCGRPDGHWAGCKYCAGGEDTPVHEYSLATQLEAANSRLVEHKQMNRELNEANQELTKQLKLARLRIERQRLVIDESVRLLEKIRR